jgi:hypothetical protein
MSPDVAAILTNKDVIAVDQDSLGVAGKRVSRTGDIEIWKKPLSGGDAAVAIFNHSNQEMRTVVSWMRWTSAKITQCAIFGHTQTAEKLLIPSPNRCRLMA